MKFHNDVFFRMGSTHRVCQDYGLTLCDNNRPCVVISDGCSTAEDSDFGSRILARCSRPYIYKDGVSDKVLPSLILASATTCAAALTLPVESLSATLLIARYLEPDLIALLGSIETVVVGDGVVAAHCIADDSIHCWEYRFPSGAPYYLRYDIDIATRNGYFQRFGNTYHVIKRILKNMTVVSETILEVNFNGSMVETLVFDLGRYDTVAVMSDGITSFIDKKQISVQLPYILSEVMGFKNYEGDFVQRRLKRALKKFELQEFQHYDDLSIGAIAVTHQGET